MLMSIPSTPWPTSRFPVLLLLVALIITMTVPCGTVMAISFDLVAVSAGSRLSEGGRCFSMYFGKDVMVRGKFTTTQVGGPAQNLDITDSSKNLIYSKKAAQGENKIVFTTHSYSDVITCFHNTLEWGNSPNPSVYRTIDFELDYNYDEVDDASKQSTTKDKLKPIEKDLRHLEKVMQGIVDEMEYLKAREVAMRDTNESTNARVKWFSLLSLSTLVGSGLWQVWYLRRFFHQKKLL